MLRESDYAELRRRLRQGGVPMSRIERLLRELDDHRLALQEDALRAGHDCDTAYALAAEELGDREAILAAMLAQPELRSIASRRPWLVYGLLPSSVLLASTALTLLASWAALSGIGADPKWLRNLIDGLFLLVSDGALWLIVIGTLLHAYRIGIAPGWPALGALLTIGLGSALSLQMVWPSAEEQAGFLHVTYVYGLRETLIAAAMVALLVLPYAMAARRISEARAARSA